MSNIIAKKGDQIREFSEFQWSNMPKGNFGWSVHVPEAEARTKKIEKEVEDSNDETSKDGSSKDLNVKDATAHIKSLDSIEEVESYTSGDERTGIKKAVEKRIEELN